MVDVLVVIGVCLVLAAIVYLGIWFVSGILLIDAIAKFLRRR